MKYALTVPFMELFFHLAHQAGGTRPAGWVGQITSNSFMKREFGSKLIEKFLPTVDLRAVIDTSGAYIPGHGTPTAILVGRNQPPAVASVRAVLGIRGEPGRPDEPAKGLVWSSITEHLDEAGFENAFVSVADLPRAALNTHPWSLSGGGAVELSAAIEVAAAQRLGARAESIGITAVTGEDDFFIAPTGRDCERLGWLRSIELVEGDRVREWTLLPAQFAGWTYDDNLDVAEIADLGALGQWLRAYRSALDKRKRFGVPMVQRGFSWYEWQELYTSKLKTPLSITFAEVATHNHFVLDRGGKVFKQTAPVIKLPAGASVEDHVRLLGVLNSSVACFWLKQNCFNKGNGGIGGGIGDEDWEPRYQYNGTTLKDFPLPANTPLDRSQCLDDLAHQFQQQSPAAVAASETPTRAALDAARAEFDRLRGLMIAQQEELDWEYYRIYGLIEDDLTYLADLPGIALGERVFEIALARRMRDGEHTAWFARHGSTPLTEIPDHLPADYRALLQRRLDAIESNC